MTDFYRLGAGLGEAYQEGQDTARRRASQDIADEQARTNLQRTRGLVSDEDYTRNRNRGFDSQYDSDVASQGQGGAAPGAGVPAPGGPGPAGQFDAMARDAARRGNAKGLGDATTAARAERYREAFNTGASLPDDQVREMVRKGNLVPPSEFPATFSEVLDPKTKQPTGYFRAVITRPNGDSTEGDSLLSLNDMRQLAGYSAAGKVDAHQATKDIAAKHGELALAFKRRFDMVKGAADTNNTATHQRKTDENNANRTAANIEIASIRASAQKLSDEAKAQNKTIPPALLEKHNKLIEEYSNSTDEKERRRLAQNINASETAIANALGKPRGLPEPKPVPEEKIDASGNITVNGKVHVPNPKKAGAYIRPEGIGPTAIEQAIEARLNGGGPGPKTGTGVPESPEDAARREARRRPAPTPDSELPVAKRSSATLRGYPPKHPDYAAARAELSRRVSNGK